MDPRRRSANVLCCCLAVCWMGAGLGCRRSNPYPASGLPTTDLATPLAAAPPTADANVPGARFDELGRRAQSLDRNNDLLHRELAEANQENQLLRDELDALRQRMNSVNSQLQDSLAARRQAEDQVKALQASTTPRGATLRANNSVQRSLRAVEIPGAAIRQEDDVIRIALPADDLFQRGSVQWAASADALLNRVAAAIRSHYPNQTIGIEGHSDSAVLGVPGGAHQLTASQALAVYQQLTRSGVPSQQLFTLGYGGNRPRVSNATPAGQQRNRRIEIVVYPETFR